MPLNPDVLAATGQGPGLDEPPDGSLVKTITPDERDPAWSLVEFADGRVENRPTAEAAALPKMPPMGPPLPPPTGPGNPPPPDAGFQLTPEQQAATAATPENTLPSGGAYSNGSGVSIPSGPPQLQLSRVDAGTPPAPQTSPDATLLDASGTQPAATSASAKVGQSEGRIEYERAVDPAQAAAQADEEFANIDLDVRLREDYERDLTGRANEAARAKVDEQLRRAQIFTEESRKALQAVEDTPIDEDFYAGSPGRQVAAWIALALSGFLTGATRGANPALQIMTQKLDKAREDFIKLQQTNKSSKLKIREKLLGDAQTAEDSIRMQYPMLVEKQAQLQAKQFGAQEIPPGVSTYVAGQRVKALEHRQRYSNYVVAQTDRRLSEEQAQATKTKAAGPVYQGDRELQTLLGPDYQKKNEQALSEQPGGGNLGNRIDATRRLMRIRDELQGIIQKHGGFPQQEQLRAGPLAPFFARHGIGDAPDEVRATQLIEELKSTIAQGGSIKLYDSVQDMERLNKIIDTGSHVETMKMLDTLIEKNNRGAIAAASRFSRNPQGYLQYIERTMGSNPGVSEDGDIPVQDMVQGPAGGGPTGGGPATPPKAPSPPATGGDRIKRAEGLRLETYDDGTGTLTIGYGHTGPDVKPGMRITKEQAEQLYANDRRTAESAVDSLVKVPLSDNQREALVSFIFNIGVTRFADSTLLEKLNTGDTQAAADEFSKWTKSTRGGVKSDDARLVRRRANERALFLTGDDDAE